MSKMVIIGGKPCLVNTVGSTIFVKGRSGGVHKTFPITGGLTVVFDGDFVPSMSDIMAAGLVSDKIAPTVQSMVLGSLADNRIVITYDEDLDTGSVPAKGDFALAGISVPISSVSVQGSTVWLILADNVPDNYTLTLSYTAGSNPVMDKAGNEAANFSAQAVTNSSSDHADVVLSVDYTATQFVFKWKAAAGNDVTFHEGDGTTQTVSGADGTLRTTTFSHATPGTYDVWLSGDDSALTYIDIRGQAFVSGDANGWGTALSLTYLNICGTGVNIEFTSTWKTDNTGTSNDDQITLPLEVGGTYNFRVNWGDGNSDTITAYNQGEVTHTYSSAGTYTVRIDGTINGFRFGNGGDKLKIIDVSKWGNLLIGNNNGYFRGCSNMNVTAIDELDVSGCTTLESAFRSCGAMTSLVTVNWDVSNVITLQTAFFQCPLLETLDVSNWDISKVTTLLYTFQNCASLRELDVSSWNTVSVTDMRWTFDNTDALEAASYGGIKNWNVTSLTQADNFMQGCANSLSTEDYEDLLVNWEAQDVNNDVTIDFNNSIFTSGSNGAIARQALIDDHNWNIPSFGNFASFDSIKIVDDLNGSEQALGCTGLSYDSINDYFIVGEYGYAYSSRILIKQKNGTLVKAIDVTSLLDHIQGVAYDQNGTYYAWGTKKGMTPSSDNGIVKGVDEDGSEVFTHDVSSTVGQAASGLQYQDGHLWFKSIGTAYKIRISDWLTIDTKTDIAGDEGFWIEADGTYWVGGTDNYLENYDSNDNLSVRYNTEQSQAEGIIIDNTGVIWWNSDEYLHGGTPNGNKVYGYTR